MCLRSLAVSFAGTRGVGGIADSLALRASAVRSSCVMDACGRGCCVEVAACGGGPPVIWLYGLEIRGIGIGIIIVPHALLDTARTLAKQLQGISILRACGQHALVYQQQQMRCSEEACDAEQGSEAGQPPIKWRMGVGLGGAASPTSVVSSHPTSSPSWTSGLRAARIMATSAPCSPNLNLQVRGFGAGLGRSAGIGHSF